MNNELVTLILAAGKGTRMKSDLAKVLHPLCGHPMIHYVIRMSREIGSTRTLAIIGHQKERVRDELTDENIEFVVQEPQLGTGHAIAQAQGVLDGYNGEILILSGDAPLLTPATMRRLIEHHRTQSATATVLTTHLPDPTGYGRIVRNPDGSVQKVVEHKDATPQERAISEINSGIYVFAAPDLFRALQKVGNDNAQREYYLPDVIPILLSEGKKVSALLTEEYEEISGINTIEQLQEAERILQQRQES